MTDKIEPIQIWRAFLDTWKLWKKGVDRNLEELGLSSTEYSILRHLKEQGKMPMVQMASLIKVTQGWITGLIDSMENKDLVRRGRIPNDRRVIELSITESGLKLFEKAREVHHAYIEKCLMHMDQESMETTVNIISELRRNIEEFDS